MVPRRQTASPLATVFICGSMNTKDFLRLGVPLGEATRRATDFVAQYVLRGGDTAKLEDEIKARQKHPRRDESAERSGHRARRVHAEAREDGARRRASGGLNSYGYVTLPSVTLIKKLAANNIFIGSQTGSFAMASKPPDKIAPNNSWHQYLQTKTGTCWFQALSNPPGPSKLGPHT